jgi:prevent-host-death family protein
MKATIADLRYRMKDVLSAVERGESVTLLYRGKPKARIVPVAQEIGAKLAEAEVFGMWKDRKDLRNVPAYVRKLRQGRFGDFWSPHK